MKKKQPEKNKNTKSPGAAGTVFRSGGKRNYLAFVKAEQEREKQFLKQEDTYVKSCLALKAELKKAGIILKETEKEREQAQKVYRDHLGLILLPD